MAPRLAFLGLGLMGQAMTTNLVNKGNLEHPIILWNRTAGVAEKHSQTIGHSSAAKTLKEAIDGADMIWICLQNQDAVLQTFDQIFEFDIKGKLFVECSTLLPEVTNTLSKKILDKGGEFVAMPVFGEPGLARKGKLVCVPGGTVESVNKVKPYVVDVIGRGVVDLGGEEPGKAALLKIIGNVLIMTTIETVAELNVFSEQSGLGTHNMRNFIQQLLPGSPHLIYWDNMASGDYYQDEATVVEVHKAITLTSKVLGLGKQVGTSLKSYEVAIDHLKVLQEAEGSTRDICGIYGAVRLESGLPFKNNANEKSK